MGDHDEPHARRTKRPERVGVLIMRADSEAVLMGVHREGPCEGRLGIPTALLGADDRPQVLAGRLAASATMGTLGHATHIVRKHWHESSAGKGRLLGGTLVYALTGVPDAALDTLNGVIEHVSSSFAQSFDHGTQELLQCPRGLIPFRRVQWCILNGAMERDSRRWDPFSLEIMRRLCPPKACLAPAQ